MATINPPALSPLPSQETSMPIAATQVEPAWASDLSCSNSDSEDGAVLLGLSSSDYEWAPSAIERQVETELLEPEERARLISDLRELGPTRVIDKYRSLSPRTLLANVDFVLPIGPDLSKPDLVEFLRLAARQYIPIREKLAQYNTIDDAVHLIRSSSKIIVLTGAGVSTSCGIPDFRSADGLYAQLSHSFEELQDPHQMFDLRFFASNPRIFYSFAKHIFPSNFTPSLSHRFLKLLEHKGKLLRNYTQNIDTLETLAGVQNVIQCHGSFATATCLKCRQTYPGTSIEEDVLAGHVVLCPFCSPKRSSSSTSSTDSQKKKRKKRKTQDAEGRGWGPGLSEDESVVRKEKEDWVGMGVVKPDIIFFGENLPPAFDHALDADREKADLLIVIGTSLSVAPVSHLLDVLPPTVPQILINREPVTSCEFDICLLGNADTIVAELCRRLGKAGDEWDPEDMRRFECRNGKSVSAALAGKVNGRSGEGARVGQSHVWLFEGTDDRHRWLDQWREDGQQSTQAATSPN